MTSTEQRLPRLLALVPYLLAHVGISAAQAAADFGITEAQLRRDLNLLWMCGLPGHGPGDLIDISFEGETVSVVFDAGMSRPLRLTNEEALAIVVALRTLAETPGLADSDAIQRALAKVETAAGGMVDDTTVTIALDTNSRLMPVLQNALDEKRALKLRYYTATRDETTERIVDPLRLFEMERHVYLEAWCRRAEGMRIFRLDRIEYVEKLGEPAAPPEHVELRDLSEGLFHPADDHLLATLRLGPSYGWVADYYSVDEVQEIDGGLRVKLRVADPGWVRSMVLGSAGQVEVLSPEWLAEGIRDQAVAALAAYSE